MGEVKMKKIIMILVAVIGFGFSAFAQTSCRVSGDEDGSTVSGSISSYDNASKSVTLSFDNDSKKYVNISFAITYTAKNGGTIRDYTQSGSVMANPTQSTSKTIKITRPIDELVEVKSITISSAKCK